MTKQEALDQFMQDNGFLHVATQHQEDVEKAFNAGFDAAVKNLVAKEAVRPAKAVKPAKVQVTNEASG